MAQNDSESIGNLNYSLHQVSTLRMHGMENNILSVASLLSVNKKSAITDAWLAASIDIYTETRCPTPLCNAWKCIAYGAPNKLGKEWLICDKLAYIYPNFFLFFCFFTSGIIFEITLKLF